MVGVSPASNSKIKVSPEQTAHERPLVSRDCQKALFDPPSPCLRFMPGWPVPVDLQQMLAEDGEASDEVWHYKRTSGKFLLGLTDTFSAAAHSTQECSLQMWDF